MESVTRPVGHLPPSVYWRRRAIVLVGLAVLIALVAWACTAGGGDGDDKKNTSAESTAPTGSGSPAPIGPGPTDGTATGGQATGSPGATGPTGGTAPGTGGNPGASGSPGAANGGTAPGATPGTSQAPPPGQQPGAGNPPGSTVNGILACQFPGNANLVVTGDRPQDTKFRVGEQVKLTLEVRNTGSETCAVDMSQRAATVEVRSGSDRIWSPADCAPGTPEITQIQPGKSVSRTWTWNWTRSDPARCSGTPPTLNTPPPGALFAATGKVAGMQWASQPFKWLVTQ
ncbi:hypothetical protein [Streptodolium elevatio]|uniref:Uncharacterized protein n=1 Tax=Streptodolium elevatio TaxID=3157996 RepID=A0ABV3DD50_9ACTN